MLSVCILTVITQLEGKKKPGKTGLKTSIQQTSVNLKP